MQYVGAMDPLIATMAGMQEAQRMELMTGVRAHWTGGCLMVIQKVFIS